MVVFIERADVEHELAREHHLGLHDMPALIVGAPDRSDADQILECVYTTAMSEEQPVLSVDVVTVSDVHHARPEAEFARVRRQCVPAQHIVAVDPRREHAARLSKTTVYRGALPSI